MSEKKKEILGLSITQGEENIIYTELRTSGDLKQAEGMGLLLMTAIDIANGKLKADKDAT